MSDQNPQSVIPLETPGQKAVDALQTELARLPQVEMPLTHNFTPGFYVRQIFMPKGTLVISKIHKTEHPYVITKGRVAVWIEGVGVKHLKAPHTGITRPGTRRVLYVHEDCVWTTFHASDQTDLERLEAELILAHEPAGCDPAIGTEIMAMLLEENT